MEQKYIYLIVGVLIGWITKFPLILKWYRELKRTKEYKRMQDDIHYQEIKERWKQFYPEKNH